MLCFGTNPAVPGDLLLDPGSPELTKPELQDLMTFLNKINHAEAKQTTPVIQEEVPEPPESVTHVYTRQHNVTGLQPQFCGPFPVVSRPSRSQVKIRVGFDKQNQPRYEIRNWRDLKILENSDLPAAERPKRGRPSKPSTTQSEADNTTDRQPVAVQGFPPNLKPKQIPPAVAGRQSESGNNQPAAESRRNSNEGGKTRLPLRSTRNPAPVYVDSVVLDHTPWSASKDDLNSINQWISRPKGA